MPRRSHPQGKGPCAEGNQQTGVNPRPMPRVRRSNYSLGRPDLCINAGQGFALGRNNCRLQDLICGTHSTFNVLDIKSGQFAPSKAARETNQKQRASRMSFGELLIAPSTANRSSRSSGLACFLRDAVFAADATQRRANQYRPRRACQPRAS